MHAANDKRTVFVPVGRWSLVAGRQLLVVEYNKIQIE
jgi:hypothetical protein